MIISYLTKKRHTSITPDTRKTPQITTGITPNTRKIAKITTDMRCDTWKMGEITTVLNGFVGVNVGLGKGSNAKKPPLLRMKAL
jgi:hypothetical protein